MSIRIEESWGYWIKHLSGECGLPDCECPVELPERKGLEVSEEQREEIQSYLLACDEEDRISLPITKVERVKSYFAKVDLGSYWSLWVVGDTREDVMEQLDDLFGIYEDYL
jgi:hypothetical protein